MTALHCQVEVSATSRSLVQSNPTECIMSVCHHKASMTRRPRPTGDVEQWGRGREFNKFLFTCGMQLMNFSSKDLRVFMNPLLVDVSRSIT